MVCVVCDALCFEGFVVICVDVISCVVVWFTVCVFALVPPCACVCRD